MIKVSYKGRLGNNLFQYSTGRVLAKRYGYHLSASPVKGFLNTKEEIDGLKFTTPSTKLRYNKVDLNNLDKKVKNTEGLHILLRGTFSYYPVLVPHKNEILKWFDFDLIDLKSFENRFKVFKNNNYETIPVENINNNDVLLHIRLGDLLKDKVKSVTRALYFDYYKIVLERIKFDRLFIISDSIESEYVKEFNNYNPICLFDTNAVDTLKFYKSFSRIIMSRSSYAWWGAWLSNAEEIYFPIPENDLWGVNNIKTDVDLRVNESRYIYVSQKERKFLGGYDSVKDIYCKNAKIRNVYI